MFGNITWPQGAATYGTHPISRHSAYAAVLLVNLHAWFSEEAAKAFSQIELMASSSATRSEALNLEYQSRISHKPRLQQQALYNVKNTAKLTLTEILIDIT